MAEPKIIDAYNSQVKSKSAGDVPPFVSFEFFPPKTVLGVQNLYERIERLGARKPLFIDVTWAAGGSSDGLSSEICNSAQNIFGLRTMMHLTCTNTSIEKIDSALKQAKKMGIRNILALRGDKPFAKKETKQGFNYAVDLVHHIKKEYGDYFCIGVAGYPEGHYDCKNYATDIKYLKEKVDAGASFILTQLFFDVDIFIQFRKDCKSIGIQCPIIPGIMPIAGFKQFSRVVTLTKIIVPDSLSDALKKAQHDDFDIQAIGLKFTLEMLKKLRQHGVHAFHFFTMNLEHPLGDILSSLQITEVEETRDLPFKNNHPQRGDEGTRPIHWRHRPKSYLVRTNNWDRYPNGRWGDNASPAYGALNDYHLLTLHTSNTRNITNCSRSLKDVSDVYNLFGDFIEGKLPDIQLPWYTEALSEETSDITPKLVSMNRKGFLTINSQPAKNGAPSTDPVYGWGPAQGFCFQKAYLEFFVSPAKFKLLQKKLQDHRSIHYISYDKKGNHSETTDLGTTAITWGVFPDSEIIQPTVVDPLSFKVWKDEAFDVWQIHWIDRLPAQSSARKVLETMLNSFHLVAMVDNNYKESTMFDLFDDL